MSDTIGRGLTYPRFTFVDPESEGVAAAIIERWKEMLNRDLNSPEVIADKEFNERIEEIRRSGLEVRHYELYDADGNLILSSDPTNMRVLPPDQFTISYDYCVGDPTDTIR